MKIEEKHFTETKLKFIYFGYELKLIIQNL